jgi:hypothetical protein
MSLQATFYHQRGENSMPKNLLSYKYIEETKSSGLTGSAGLSMYLDLMCRLGVVQALRTHLDGNIHHFCAWNPSDIASVLLMLNLSGGDNVEDLKKIQADSGFCALLAKFLDHELPLLERRNKRIKRAQGSGSVPSASTVLRFLKRDGTDGLEGRGQGHAHIPESGATAQQLAACNKALLGALYTNKPCLLISALIFKHTSFS